jgi:hypothetical protein
MKKFTLLIIAILLTSCAKQNTEYKYPQNTFERQRSEMGSIITGYNDNIIFNKPKKQDTVNKNIWNAALDVMSFMPFASADINNGIITTEWFSPNNIKNERFKFTVIVLSNKLKANTLKITAFKEILGNDKTWHQSAVSKELITDLETKILSKARQLNISNR